MPETLQESTVKDDIIRMIQRLPDDCTLEDIEYHMYVRTKMEKVLATLDDGKDLTQEQAEQRVAGWLESFGKKQLSKTSKKLPASSRKTRRASPRS